MVFRPVNGRYLQPCAEDFQPYVEWNILVLAILFQLPEKLVMIHR